MSENIEELRAHAARIAANPDAVYDMNIEDLLNTRKYLNPLGNITGTKKVYINMGIINWRERYLRKLHTTALISYLYQLNQEWEPEVEIARRNVQFKQKCENINKLNLTIEQKEDRIKGLAADHEDELKLLRSTARGIVKQFLDRNFDYNPTHHVRGSHSENAKDPSRRPKDECIKAACKNAERAATIDSKLSGKQDQTYTYLRNNLLATYQAAAEATNTLKAVLSVMLDSALDAEDKQGILIKKYKHLQTLTADMKKIAEPLSAAETLNAWKVNPPVDVFHQFDRYLTNHYEQLREVVEALYNEKADFEFAIMPHKVHKTPEDARDYRKQHESEFRTEVFAVETNAVNLIGPFKENRQKVDFYNKHTEIMQRMMDQVESDHKLGADLMKKERTKAKKKNIEEAGPDSPELAKYVKVQNQIRELGAQPGLSIEDQRKLVSAKDELRTIQEDYEVPDDSIRVDMFYQDTENGERVMKKKHFFSQAEEPLHMQEGSQYVDQYQPVRNEDEPMETREKTIVSRTGEKKTIRVLATDINKPAEIKCKLKGKAQIAAEREEREKAKKSSADNI